MLGDLTQSLSTKRREAAVSLRKTYGIETRSLLAKDITYRLQFDFDYRPGAIAVVLTLHGSKYQETTANLV